MDIAAKLAQSEANLQKLVEKFNALEAEKQEVLKEVLRTEGEVRILKELEAIK